MRLLKIFKEQKAGMISGIISSAVFLYFIQPILEFLAHMFVVGSNFIGSAYTDRIYQQVAHLETQDYSFLFFMIIMSAPAGVMLGISIRIFFPFIRIRRAATVTAHDSKTIKMKLNSYFLATTTLMGAFFLFLVVIANFIQLSTISSFKRHVRIIAPYISLQEEREIISQWSLINSKKDYQKIYIKIESIAKKNSIVLPENKIYSLLSI